jgi:hypothetical protein
VNRGISPDLKAAFPHIIPASRPLVNDQEIKDPHWVAGFVDGEGNFDVRIQESKTHKIGSAVNIGFRVAQHSRDAELMKSIVQYFACGISSESSSMSFFTVTKFSDIEEKIIPFLEKYPLQGVKSLDYADFKRVAEIMKDKGHFTATGLDQIRKIKCGMNRGRDPGLKL